MAAVEAAADPVTGLVGAGPKAKDEEDAAVQKRKALLQGIVDTAKEYNVCRFRSGDGTTAQFAKDGSFRMRMPAEVKCG